MKYEDEIIGAVAQAMELDVDGLRSRTHSREYTDGRRIAASYLLPYFTLKEVGEMFDRDHSTTIYWRNTHNDLCRMDKKYMNLVKRVHKRVGNREVGLGGCVKILEDWLASTDLARRDIINPKSKGMRALRMMFLGWATENFATWEIRRALPLSTTTIKSVVSYHAGMMNISRQYKEDFENICKTWNELLAKSAK